MDFHSLKINDCLEKLKTTREGLTAAEAAKRLNKYGENIIPREKPLGSWKIFFRQFRSSLVYILLGAGILSVILGAWIDAGVIFGAVILNVIIGFFQENKANQALSKLREMIEHKVIVVRDGADIELDSRLVTVGDIILIKAGNRIPADARLIEAVDLQVNEAALTGESLPSAKKTEPVLAGAALADRENMVYAGTMVVSGWGRAVVTAVGAETELGKVAQMVKETKEEKTPLQARLERFSRLLGIIVGVIAFLIVVAGLIQGREFIAMIETGVAVGVAAIPEGLTVAVTFILALGMQRILRQKALTRKLVAAETLGSTTVICSDKTGTLTEGKMHVAHIIIGEKEFELETLGSRQNEKEAKAVSLALQTAMMCNDAIVENPHDELKSWRFIGSPTEVALLSAAIQSGLNKEKLLAREPQVAEMPFDSGRKFMLSLHKRADGRYILYEKGAGEVLLTKSTKFFHLGKIQKLTDKEKTKLNRTYEKLTARGLRVIGLAIREMPKDFKLESPENVNWSDIDCNLTFIGFIALKDPLRPEARETIELCQKAGIRPILITGDHQLTAKAIGEEVGLKVKTENIITGAELDKINDVDLIKIINKINIYARVSPHHKLRIVKALRAQGEVVAMTGDGINDSPALKAADIGISLGTGTDIAKETADLILLDNNFRTIVSAVREGRVIFKNIRKVITYLISDSFSEVILILGSIIFNTPLALLPAQILWINIVNDGLPDFSLAFERDHGSVMTEKPLKKDEPLLNREMKRIIFGAGIFRDVVIFIFFYWLWIQNQGNPAAVKRVVTLIFIILGVKSLLSIFSLRSFSQPIWRYHPFSNRYLIGAVAASLFLLVISVYWPPLQMILHTVSLGPVDWLIAFGFGLFNILLIEGVKLTSTYARQK